MRRRQSNDEDQLVRIPNGHLPNMSNIDHRSPANPANRPLPCDCWSDFGEFLCALMPEDRKLSWPERFRFSLVILCLSVSLMLVVVFVMLPVILLPVIAAHVYEEWWWDREEEPEPIYWE